MPDQFTIGPWSLDAQLNTIRRDDRVIRLEPKVMEVCACLADRAGKVVRKEDLIRAVWHDTFVTDDVLTHAISELRKALEDDAKQPKFIETIPKRGYRLIASVRHEQPGVSNPSLPAVPLSPRQRSWTRLSAVLAVGLLGAAVFAFWTYRRSAQSIRTNSPEMEITKVINRAKVDCVAISPDGRYLVYALREKGRLSLRAREIGTQSDVQILPPEPLEFKGLTFSPDGTHVYFSRSVNSGGHHSDLYTLPVLGGTPRLLIKDVDSPVGFSPDGGRFMFVRRDVKRNAAEVRLANGDGTGERLLATINEAAGHWVQNGGSWSPDGQMIAVSVVFWGGKPGSELTTISVADGSVHALYASPSDIGRPLWLPAGNALVVVLYEKEGAGQLWTISYPSGEAKPLTHDLENYDPLFDMTPDGKTIAANAAELISNLYVLPATDFSRAQQLTFGRRFVDSVTVGPDGRLLVHEMLEPQGELWKMNADGSQRVLFGRLRNTTNFVVRCGTSVVLLAAPKDTQELIRVDADGLNPKTLTSGNIWSPSCSLDGRFVFYADLVARPQRILRVSIEGGNPVEIAKVSGDGMTGTMDVSPDGRFLAYPYHISQPDTFGLIVISVEGGAPVKTFPINADMMRWSPDGTRIHLDHFRDHYQDIFEQPLAGGELRQLTNFRSGGLRDFYWSPDGEQLYVARGEINFDTVLIRNFR
jgi:eukaryotic-like serine/threonine-protein kinase